MEEKQETKKTIKISLRTAILVGILIVVMILAIIGLVAYMFIKDNKQENKIKNVVKQNKVDKEVEEVIQLTEFTPKSFDQKYMDLYNIVKGTEKVVNGITYAYRSNTVNNIIDSVESQGIMELSVSDKLSIIADKINVYEIQTVQDIKEIIKKYYGIEENGEFPERLDIITGTNKITHFGKQDNNYQMQAQSGITNVGSYVLGLLDSVEDTGDTVVIKEKVVFVKEGNNEITFGTGIWADDNIAKNKKLEQFDIGKYYDDLGSYEYTFKKNGDNYNLVDIKFKSAVENYIEENSYAYKHFKEGLEVETLLPKNESLKITNVEKDDEGNFIITGNVYEECIISKETLEGLKNGETINLYGKEYRYEYKKGIKPKKDSDRYVDWDREYEIEQLIPIEGGKGVYLISMVTNVVGQEREETVEKSEEYIRLRYAQVEDFVETIGSQGDIVLFEKKPVETITVKSKNVKMYGICSMNEFYSENVYSSIAEIYDLESMFDGFKGEGGEEEDDICFNFIMRDGEVIEIYMIMIEEI